MKINVSFGENLFSLEVPEDLELENLKAFCEEFCSGKKANELVVIFNNVTLNDDKKTLNLYGIIDGDLIKLKLADHGEASSSSVSKLDFSSIQVPQYSNKAYMSGVNDPSMLRDMLLANPDQLANLRQSNPSLAEAVLSGTLDEFADVLRQQYAEKQKNEEKKIKLLTSNPFDYEAQSLIAEEIRQKNIEANMEAAIEYNPEIFGTVIMLYIDCKVNGHPVKAFIDSGAQATIMSQAAAARCEISRLIDSRWAGIAKGVGVQRIIGRIHMCTIQIESDFLTSSFSVLEQQPMDMLLGLDMLRRHQCCIDLKNNVLIIGTTGTKTNFLTESQLPDCARLTGSPEEEQKAIEESKRIHEELEISEAIEKSRDGPSTSQRSFHQEQKQKNLRIQEPHNFSEADVAELTIHGFSRQAVIDELLKFKGNKTQALAALFAKSLKF